MLQNIFPNPNLYNMGLQLFCWYTYQTDQLINSRELSLNLQAASCYATQEFVNILWKMSQINPAHTI
jgi:hypothetical protein